MKFIRKFLIALLLLLFSAAGCIESVEAPWNTEPIPVAFSVITPGHPIEVYLGKTYTEKDTTQTNLYPEARVFVCGVDSVWVELTRRTADTAIFSDIDNQLAVEKGKTYSLRIELKDKTLHAQTSVPNESGVITWAECIVTDTSSFRSTYGIRNVVGALRVNYSLPANKQLGCYLFANSREVGYTAYISGENIQESYFFCYKDSTSFLLNLITMDPYLKKFRVTTSINELQSTDFLSAILGSYGGVRPTFSNIQNGTGLFGSFVTESKKVEITVIAK
ncbi:MAG TPA: DUF4249 family protein [Paludibacter sp.]